MKGVVLIIDGKSVKLGPRAQAALKLFASSQVGLEALDKVTFEFHCGGGEVSLMVHARAGVERHATVADTAVGE